MQGSHLKKLKDFTISDWGKGRLPERQGGEHPISAVAEIVEAVDGYGNQCGHGREEYYDDMQRDTEVDFRNED